MSYELHIERECGISIDSWKRAVASIPGVRLDRDPWTTENPATGESITIQGRDGDAAVVIAGKWVKVFGFHAGTVSFNARTVAFDDPDDSVAQAVTALARALEAKIVGDEGEEYG